MGFAQSVQRFRNLHERAKTGAAAGPELATYRAARDECARLVASLQNLPLQPGQCARRALRVGRALQADLELRDGTERAVTLELSIGGFSVLLGRAPSPGDAAAVALRIPRGSSVRSKARVVSTRVSAGTARVSFEFTEMDPEDSERLELFIFDAVLDQLRFEPALA